MITEKYKILYSDRLILRVLNGKYASPVLNFLEEGRYVFDKYEASKNQVFYTPYFQENMLNLEYNAFLKKQYLRYYFSLKEYPDQLIGTISFGNLLPEPYLSCNIGYKVSPEYMSLGYCSEAATTAINAAFSYLKIHKINAFVQKDNLASIKVLEKNGFILEGKCIKNIRVNGIWTDHLLYGLINQDF